MISSRVIRRRRGSERTRGQRRYTPMGNPNGYCGLGGTGVACPIGTAVTTELTGARRRYGAAAGVSVPIVPSRPPPPASHARHRRG